MSGRDDIRARLDSVRQRIERAAREAGRDGSAVQIVAVTKKLGLDTIRAAYDAGHRDFGENYVQEAAGKIGALRESMPDARWHFIGRLQSNKAATAVRNFSLLHGIDSPSTVASLSRAAVRENRTMDRLLQVRLGHRGAGGGASSGRAGGGASSGRAGGGASGGRAGGGALDGSSAGEASRGGVEPADARDFLEQASVHPAIRFIGLMGVADPDLDARPQFARLRELSDELAAHAIERAPLGELSMGMTGDFEDAVTEGATIVRIGTAIFGERPRG